MGMGTKETLIVNSSSPLIEKLNSLLLNDEASAHRVASYIYKLAILSQRRFSAEELNSFLEDSFSLLESL